MRSFFNHRSSVGCAWCPSWRPSPTSRAAVTCPTASTGCQRTEEGEDRGAREGAAVGVTTTTTITEAEEEEVATEGAGAAGAAGRRRSFRRKEKKSKRKMYRYLSNCWTDAKQALVFCSNKSPTTATSTAKQQQKVTKKSNRNIQKRISVIRTATQNKFGHLQCVVETGVSTFAYIFHPIRRTPSPPPSLYYYYSMCVRYSGSSQNVE